MSIMFGQREGAGLSQEKLSDTAGYWGKKSGSLTVKITIPLEVT